MIHVCSLTALAQTVKTSGASHVLTVMANVDQVRRPHSILEANHLKVSMDDINEPVDGFVAPALNPHRDEISIARQIRAASPIAQPNRLIVALADKALGRGGRMLRAVDEMGPGDMTIEGRPFRIDLE
ncbi:MAG: hypothetical protein K0Q70_841 [Rhodospirillales bacterium]|nr:hypothetical protein [Rhodospirillales bacterium]